MQINQEDLDKLKQIEESLWIAETRFDKEYMGRIAAGVLYGRRILVVGNLNFTK